MAQFSRELIKGTVELVSSGAILIGLIFVGLELRQSTIASEADTMQGLLELNNHALYEIATDPEFAQLIIRAQKSLDDLTESERLRYLSHINADFNTWEHMFYSYDNGTMNERLWESWDQSFYSLYCTKSSKVIWQQIQSYFGDAFRAHIQELTEEDCASTGSPNVEVHSH